MTAASEINKIIVRQLQRHKLEYEIDLDPNQNSDVVYCRDFNNFPRPLDKKCIFSDCTDTELVQLFNAVIDCKPLDFDIICEICKMLPTKGYLVHDKLEKIILSSKFDPSDRELLFAYLGSDKKYETKIIELLDTIPTGFRYGLFLACFHLNTPAICRKLMEKFTQWIKNDPDYGNGTGEGQFLEKFIVLWQNTQDRELVNEFAAFCRKNWHYAKEEKMKTKRILQYLGIMLFGVLAFFIGFYCGIDDYKSDLIAVKHIDGKYGKAFYGVEVWGKDIGNRIEIYARIHIGGVDKFYYHDCGKIGIAFNWQDAKEKFGNISFDGSVLSIGNTYSIKKEKYENHR